MMTTNEREMVMMIINTNILFCHQFRFLFFFRPIIIIVIVIVYFAFIHFLLGPFHFFSVFSGLLVDYYYYCVLSCEKWQSLYLSLSFSFVFALSHSFTHEEKKTRLILSPGNYDDDDDDDTQKIFFFILKVLGLPFISPPHHHHYHQIFASFSAWIQYYTDINNGGILAAAAKYWYIDDISHILFI